jgi:dTMP kinase
MKPHGYPGTFITMEGIDGCGKSTQIELLKNNLQSARSANPTHVVIGREPGSTKLCAELRDVIIGKHDERWCYPAETLLFFADRIQHLNERVLPSIKSGSIYISDRYVDSTLAYQGLRVADTSLIHALIKLLNVPAPDMTFWIKLDPEVAYKRANERPNLNLYDVKPLSFYQQLHRQFERLFKDNPRVVTINGSGKAEDVAARVWGEYIIRAKK